VDLNIIIDYPDYSGLPDAAGNPNDGNIAALKGSSAILTGLSNKPLDNSYILFSDSSEMKLNIDGKHLSGKFDITENSRYTIALLDSAGRINPEPIWYDIQLLEDYPPSIEIIYPANNVDLSEDMILPVDVFITDDYGFGKFNLVWWIASEGGQSEPARIDLKIENKKELEHLVRYPWDIEDIGPMPGDLIYYYCEVSDNDIISGPKWSKSKTYVARLPSLDEILAEVQGSQEQQIEDIEDVMRDQHELQEKLNEISRELLKATEVKWETQQEARGALEKQKEIAENLEKLSREMQENLDRLEENRLIGEEIAEKMRELNELMEEVATPELKEAMKKLSEALQNMDPEEMKKALEQFQMSAEELLENLERSLSLMKQLAIEQKMDLLAELAEKILNDQVDINEKAVACKENSAELADLETPQQANQDQFNSLKEQFEELKKMDQETQLVPEDSKSEADKQLNNPEIPEDFNGMKSSMNSGNKGSCRSKGKRLKKNLSDLADAMKNARNSMQQQMRNQIARKLQKAAEDILYLSNRQESVLDSTRAYDRTREMIRGFAGQQSQIESAATRSAELISEISNETVFISLPLLRLMGQILEDLAVASEKLDQSQSVSAIQSEMSAMANMNIMVMLLLQAKNNACNSNSGSGMKEMMERLSQCTKGQRGINNQTLMQMPQQGMPLSLSQQQSLQRLAAEQEALRQQMNELNDEFGKRGEMLGRLDALGEEMKKVAEDLNNFKVDRKTIERQEKILSRLLDTQKSVNRREYSRKRKAETGSDYNRTSPELPADLLEENERLMNIIKKALQEKYPRKYDRLIKAYFKSLQNDGAAFE
jgi:chromosome segregation ATPase